MERICYLGGLVPEDAKSEHIVSRRETGEVLRRGPVPVTEIRAGIIVGPGSAAFEVMRDLVYHLPVMVTPRWVRAKSPPIALDNLLEYLVRAPALPETAGGIYDAAGPEELTYQAMMRILAEAAGRRPPWIIPVPVLSPKLSAYWLRFVTSVPTPIARALIEGLKHDFSAHPEALRALVPQRLLGFRESVEAAFAAERNAQVQARWTEGAFNMRKGRLDYAYYAKRAGGSAVAEAPASAVWSVVAAIGGDNRYYFLNGLWTLREVIDWALGGQGLRHGRRHPTELRVGDRIDSWEVIGIEPERRLTLAFGMRAPGAGVLEFEIEPLPGNRRPANPRHRHRLLAPGRGLGPPVLAVHGARPSGDLQGTHPGDRPAGGGLGRRVGPSGQAAHSTVILKSSQSPGKSPPSSQQMRICCRPSDSDWVTLKSLTTQLSPQKEVQAKSRVGFEKVREPTPSVRPSPLPSHSKCMCPSASKT